MSDPGTEEAPGAAASATSRPRGLRPGDFIVHSACRSWGVGIIVAGRSGMNVTVLFENGAERIISRNFHSVLQPIARPENFDPPVTAAPAGRSASTRQPKQNVGKRTESLVPVTGKPL